MVLRPQYHRWWLAVAYMMAAVLAHCAHRHGGDHDDTPPHCLASCGDARVHLSGHAAQDLDRHGADCPACHFRSDHQAGLILAAAPFHRAAAAATPDRPAHRPGRTSTLPPNCRAPPRS